MIMTMTDAPQCLKAVLHESHREDSISTSKKVALL